MPTQSPGQQPQTTPALPATPQLEPTTSPTEIPLGAPRTTPEPLPSIPSAPAPEPTATPGASAPPQVPIVSKVPEPPSRDLFEISQRLGRSGNGPVSRIVNPEPVSYQEGHQDTFWIADFATDSAYTIQATLKIVSEHAYWYVDDSISLPIDELRSAAEVFDREIRPVMVASFGDIWSPGIDNDPRLTIMHTPLNAVLGYYGSRDEFPKATQPRSNEREMIYMNSTSLQVGSGSYLAVLTHEFQHAIHWNQDAGEDSWVNEGISEVAEELLGFPARSVQAFLRNSDIQLNYWPDELRDTIPHYGASNLFFSYIAQHYGGFENLGKLVKEQGDGIIGVNAYLSSYGTTFENVFNDWVIANYIDEVDGPYSYPDRNVRVRNSSLIVAYGVKSESLPQFSTRYNDLRLRQGDALVTFDGETEVGIVGTECYSGEQCWWGNRGDSIDTKLTREFDLSELTKATLEFWTWFKIEDDFDYAYVEISTDAGGTWTLLEGQHTTTANPTGANFGNGITGDSNGWVKETMDLTPYVGGPVLLRFEYITDDGVYVDGFVIDDIAIPELEFFDDAERDTGWLSEGFVRLNPVLPQHYKVRVIEETLDGKFSITEVELDEENSGHVLIEGFGTRIKHAVVVISPMTRDTHQSAPYSMNISRVTP